MICEPLSSGSDHPSHLQGPPTPSVRSMNWNCPFGGLLFPESCNGSHNSSYEIYKTRDVLFQGLAFGARSARANLRLAVVIVCTLSWADPSALQIPLVIRLNSPYNQQDYWIYHPHHNNRIPGISTSTSSLAQFPALWTAQLQLIILHYSVRPGQRTAELLSPAASATLRLLVLLCSGCNESGPAIHP